MPCGCCLTRSLGGPPARPRALRDHRTAQARRSGRRVRSGCQAKRRQQRRMHKSIARDSFSCRAQARSRRAGIVSSAVLEPWSQTGCSECASLRSSKARAAGRHALFHSGVSLRIAPASADNDHAAGSGTQLIPTRAFLAHRESARPILNPLICHAVASVLPCGGQMPALSP